MTISRSDPQPRHTPLGEDERSDESETPYEEKKDEGDEARPEEEVLEDEI
jgi:hypothetical protein